MDKKISLFLLLTILVYCQFSYAKCNSKIIVAIIDTGFGYGDRGLDAKLCQTGHRDYSGENIFTNTYHTKDPIPLDTIGHGTNIVGIIDSYINDINYCIVVLKFYRKNKSNNTLRSTIDAINYATSIGAKYINYSAGGYIASLEERIAVISFLDNGGTFITAAGNEGLDLDFPFRKHYPSSYDPRIISVGMLNRDGTVARCSNYGKIIKRWEIGEDVVGFGLQASGTSQSTAVATGKILSQDKNKCDIGSK